MKADYPAILRPLSEEEGGGYLIEYPDLPGCMSDGETAVEALHNGQDAVQAYLKDMQASGESIPISSSKASGQWRQRAPRSIHARLTVRARDQGISLNALVMSYIAEGLSRREPPRTRQKDLGKRKSNT
jgi:antitoxin HicB